MSRELFSPNKTPLPAIPEPIELGGTGATTAATALQNLGGAAAAALDQVNGLAQLDANTKVKVENLPSINVAPEDRVEGLGQDAPYTVFIGQTAKFLISNYDSQRQYDLTTTVGTADLVTYEDFLTCRQPLQ